MDISRIPPTGPHSDRKEKSPAEGNKFREKIEKVERVGDIDENQRNRPRWQQPPDVNGEQKEKAPSPFESLFVKPQKDVFGRTQYQSHSMFTKSPQPSS